MSRKSKRILLTLASAAVGAACGAAVYFIRKGKADLETDFDDFKDEFEEEESAPAEKKCLRDKFIADKKIDIISTFPVPNTKEDIIEFLALSVAGANKRLGFLDIKINCYKMVAIAGIIIPFFGWLFGAIFIMSKSFAEEKMKNAWREKFDQVMSKGRSLRGDAEFTQQLDYYESILEE